MSFIKELFEKRKDKKYGKGHRLGASSEPSYNDSRNAQSSSQSTATEFTSQTPRSEAAIMAGKAALERFEQQNKPRSNSGKSNSMSTREKEMREAKNLEKDMEKALQLKSHYFGEKQTMDNNPIIPKNRVYFKSAVFGANEKYTKDEIDQRIESSVMNQIDEEPILASVTLLFTANYKNPDKLNKCVEVLNKYIDNIMKSPNEEKFRKIKLENAVFKEKVYSCKYADLVLKKSGFKPTTIRTNDVEEDFFVYDNSDLTNLENLQSALSLGEPIIPELDRDLKIFKVTNTSKIADFELSDEFYNFTVEDLIKEQKLRNEAIEKSGMLRTKAMREKDEQLESRRYNYSLIRIRFPNDFILQAVFKTSEKFDEIYKLVSECLETNSIPFDLIGHSLKKNATLSSTLGEIGLAPSAVLNFKWNIDGQITGNVIKKSLIESASYLK